MKHFLIILSSLLMASAAFANNSEFLKKMLDAPAVVAALDGIDSYEMKFDAENISTTWTYTARFSYQKNVATQQAGLEKSVPCSLTAEIQTFGGVAGTEVSDVVVEESCMQLF